MANAIVNRFVSGRRGYHHAVWPLPWGGSGGGPSGPSFDFEYSFEQDADGNDPGLTDLGILGSFPILQNFEAYSQGDTEEVLSLAPSVLLYDFEEYSEGDSDLPMLMST